MSTNNNKKLMVVDDDSIFCDILERALGRQGLEVTSCQDAESALRQMKTFRPAYVVLDLRLENESGMQLIEPLLAIDPEVRILVLTGFASLATAVQAIKLGAMDYLAKPVGVPAIMQAFGLLEKAQEETEIPENPVSLKRLEWEQIQRVLKENDGNITNTAKQLGMYRRTLQRKLQKKPDKW